MGAIIRQAGEGEQLWFAGGGALTIKAGSAETDGSLMAMEDVMTRGKTTPLHTHPAADETIYVIEGELLVHADGAEHALRAGGLVVIPRGVVHALLVTSERARILCLITPGTDAEAFFRAASDPLTSGNAADAADVPRLMSVAAGSPSIEVLGPPPFALTPA